MAGNCRVRSEYRAYRSICWPQTFALKAGGYGRLLSLEGIDEEGLTDQELEARVRGIEAALRGMLSILPTVQAFRSCPALPATNSLRSSRHRHSSKTRVTVLV